MLTRRSRAMSAVPSLGFTLILSASARYGLCIAAFLAERIRARSSPNRVARV